MPPLHHDEIDQWIEQGCYLTARWLSLQLSISTLQAAQYDRDRSNLTLVIYALFVQAASRI
jgi:hypothetical protein